MSDISDEQKNPTETQNNAKDELSEQDLDQVSGGCRKAGGEQIHADMPTGVEMPVDPLLKL